MTDEPTADDDRSTASNTVAITRTGATAASDISAALSAMDCDPSDATRVHVELEFPAATDDTAERASDTSSDDTDASDDADAGADDGTTADADAASAAAPAADSDADAAATAARTDGDGMVGRVGPAENPGGANRSSSWAEVSDDDRVRGDFVERSAYHVVASEVARQVGEVRQRDVREACTEMPDGTIAGAFTDLYKRRILDRREPTEDEAGAGYRYTLSAHGAALLAEKGMVTEADWLA